MLLQTERSRALIALWMELDALLKRVNGGSRLSDFADNLVLTKVGKPSRARSQLLLLKSPMGEGNKHFRMEFILQNCKILEGGANHK